MDKPKNEIPREFADALKKNKAALSAFQKTPPSHQREYLKYILQAKKPETRARRIQESIKRLAHVGET